MAQWLRALAALPEDPGSIPSTYMTAHNSPLSITLVPELPTPSHRHMQANTKTRTIKKKKLKKKKKRKKEKALFCKPGMVAHMFHSNLSALHVSSSDFTGKWQLALSHKLHRAVKPDSTEKDLSQWLLYLV